MPPQIRVKVTPPTETRATTNLSFTVAGEHLFGSPAKSLPAEGAVLFEASMGSGTPSKTRLN